MVQLTIDETVEQLTNELSVIEIVNLDLWELNQYDLSRRCLVIHLQSLQENIRTANQKILFTNSKSILVEGEPGDLILRNLQEIFKEIHLDDSVAIVVSTNPDLLNEIRSTIKGYVCLGDFNIHAVKKHPITIDETYKYGSANPLKVNLKDLNEQENFLLKESKVFCIYPWVHLHTYPTGEAHPCCFSERPPDIGSTRVNTLKELWNAPLMKELRLDLLNERVNPMCVRCHEQQEVGFFSGRQSANKHHGHHIKRVFDTNLDGSYDDFKMTYWDIRFSNLCNLRCRSCGPIFSSQWYQDQVDLVGKDWASKNKVLNFAGRHKMDMWEQLLPHIDYVEQIYFAGGEPLIMDEHYRILDELERRQRFDVRLIYNTNFTETKLKDRFVFDYWKNFKNVSVGASLDDMGPRAEYIRKGTDWAQVEDNRRRMLDTCPDVDFYISPTLSIMNALSLPDFHRDWVEKGFIQARDLNVNILQDPAYYRIDIATSEYKEKIHKKYLEHLDWLRPQDGLKRATVGFESAINYLLATNNSHLIPEFWRRSDRLDAVRGENMLDVIPELTALK